MTHAPVEVLPALRPAAPAAQPRHSAAWGWAAGCVLLLLCFAWAGTGPATWPESPALHTYNAGGWIIPARGLGQILLTGGLLFAFLCGLMRRARHLPFSRGLPAWIAGVLLVAVALEMRIVMVRAWPPLEFSGVAPRSTAGWRIAAALADMATLALLLLALLRSNRSLWLAALFAWHPLVLLGGAAAGAGVSCLLPLLVLLAFPWRWRGGMREILIITPAALAVWAVARASLASSDPINGLVAACLRDLGVEGRAAAVCLIAIAAMAQAAVVWLALKRRWNLPHTLAHIFLLAALVSPRVGFGLLLPLAALAPLAFAPAAWALTGTALLLFFLQPAGGPVLAEWLLFLALVPPWVLEMADLLARNRRT